MTAQVAMLTDEAVQESAYAYGDANETYDGEVQAYIDGARFARDRYEAREKLWRELARLGSISDEYLYRSIELRRALGIDKEGA